MSKTSGDILLGLAHSLGKFFPESRVPEANRIRLSGLRGEVLAFQVVYMASEMGQALSLELSGPLAEHATQRQVGLVAVEHPTYREKPALRIGKAPGYFPDPLLPTQEYPVLPDQTRAIWITIAIPADAEGGASDLVVTPIYQGRKMAALRAGITVVPALLPRQELLMIHWFHNDCLLSHYGIPAWSNRHWAIVRPYLENAAAHGINTITTPIFTPPMDTAVGSERPTVQLVDVTVLDKDRYRFGFRKLEKWIDLCQQCGMTHFEISPLFAQWGAKSAPKIVARQGNAERRIFGWSDSSTGTRYRKFLLQFLPQFVACLKRKKALGRSFLHVSDEPSIQHLPTYGKAREILREGAAELPVLESLSDISFFEKGLVDRPCPSTDHAGPFLERGVPHLWCYYCCSQARGVSNRFMDFPSARNRILGWQLHKFGFEGFGHWGYNYWFAELGPTLIDPYTHTHSGRRLPPGDGYVVYPGEEGPVDSIRWEVFREGLQDMRALKLLASLDPEGRSQGAQRLLALDEIASLSEYPQDASWILEKRAAVNRLVARLG